MMFRKIKKIMFLAAFTALACGASAQSSGFSRYEHLITPQSQKRHIDTLCSPAMAGRAMGSEGGEKARLYIADEFRKYGVRKRGIYYEQSFLHKTNTGKNVIGEISSGERNGDYIIICAHYDHLGMIDSRFYPGANDNASGVAALLELARVFGCL